MADGHPLPGAVTTSLKVEKFHDPDVTAGGAIRARVEFSNLETLWVNTGTLCNIECGHCYIQSSPSNDRLSYISLDELSPYLDEAQSMGAREVGFTGGEPFMNPEMLEMAEAVLTRGLSVLILTNAMRPMMRTQIKEDLLVLHRKFNGRIKLRVSLDHFNGTHHDEERGENSFAAALIGLRWLADNGFAFSIAGRLRWDEDENAMRRGFAKLFATEQWPLDANAPQDLIVFPEMNETADAPEITNECWGKLDKKPGDLMCATSRMLIKRKGAPAPCVLSCTLLAYDQRFEMGATLQEAARAVKLNHPHCATFCVLGGASCAG